MLKNYYYKQNIIRPENSFISYWATDIVLFDEHMMK